MFVMHLIPNDDSKMTEEKQCARCGRVLNKLYNKELCPVCMEIELFHDVKEYIRENNVREGDVAEHFHIPLRKVHNWIKEGRIQYKEEKTEKIADLTCKVCGKPISFGMVCAECHSKQNLQVVTTWEKKDDDKMRFLGQGKD